MIQTNPSYVHGDNLTIGEYFKGMIRNERFLYASMWNWWKKNRLLNQLQYLLRKLHCFSPYSRPSWEEKICNWLRSIDKPTPTDITAIHIGLFESENSNYMLYLIGARHYDENDDDWACVEDFVPEQKYTDIHVGGIEDVEWEEILHTVIHIISRYVEKRAEDASSLFYHKIVTVGFDEGDLTRIR